MANVIKHKRGSGSDPSASNLVVGELAIRTDNGKLFTKMDSGAIAEIAGGGSDIAINTLSSSSATGGGSATFNGSAYRFTLSSPPSVSAAQLLVSVNGVIQKPVAGTGQPSEGFSVDGNDIIFGDAPATGADFFILTFRSLGVSEPADNSVTSAKIVDGTIVGTDLATNIDLVDNQKLRLGNSQDLMIYHHPTDGSIINHFGNNHLVIRSGNRIDLRSANDDTYFARFVEDGAAELYHDGNKKFETYNQGVSISGNLVASGTIYANTNLEINNVAPQIFLVDSNNNSDFALQNNNGSFIVRDTTNSANRLVIDSSGKVGIGTTSPVGRLTVDENNASEHFQLRNTTNTSNFAAFGLDTSFNLRIYTNGQNERMRIDSSGRVLIGTTNTTPAASNVPGIVFGDNTAGTATAGIASFCANGAAPLLLTRRVSDGNVLGIADDAGTKGLLGVTSNDLVITAIEELRFSTGAGQVERMRLTNAGRLGIGLTGPSSALHVKSSSGTQAVFESTGSDNASIQFKDSTTTDSIVVGALNNDLQLRCDPGNIVFKVANNTEKVRIDSSGRVGIRNTSMSSFNGGGDDLVIGDGTDHQDAGITLLSHSSDNGSIFFNDSADANLNGLIQYRHSENAMRFLTSGTERMRIDSSGNVGIGTTADSGVKLHVQHNGEANMILEGNVNGQGGFLMLKNNSDNANTTMSIQNLDAGGQGTSDITFQNVSNANNEGFMMFKTRPSGGSMTERMRIDSTGRILINTTHTVSRLFVNGGSLSIAGSDSNFNGGNARVFIDHDNNDVRFGFTGGGGSAANKGMRFHHCPNSTGTANTNRITEIGEFKIGHDGNSDAAVSTDKVHTIGGCNTDSVTSNLARLCMQERSGNWISFKDGGGTHHGTISRSGSGVSYGSNSDYRLKDNVANLTGGIAFVKQLRPVTFNWNDLSGLSKTETHQGFIAHEVQALMSDAVEGEKDGIDIWGDCTDSEGNVTQTHVPESKKKDGETWTKKGEDIHDQQLDTGKLIPILTAALQEAIGRIEALEAK